MSELIFTKDGITVRTPVHTPLIGETVHEEKMRYDKLPVDGVQITITSINRDVDEAGNLKALSFKFRDIGPLSESSTSQETLEIMLTSGSIQHGYFNLGPPNRRFFPGYKTPFSMRDGTKQYSVHVTSGEANARIGDPDEGIQIVGGLQEFFNRHKPRVGDKVRFT